jgi:hypothetical protein
MVNRILLAGILATVVLSASCGLVLGFSDEKFLATDATTSSGGSSDGGSLDGSADAVAPEGGICAGVCGCFGAPKTLATEQIDARGILTHGARVYWVTPGRASNLGTLATVEKSGAGFRTLKSNLNSPRGLAADSTALFAPSKTGGCDPGIFKVPFLQGDASIAVQGIQVCGEGGAEPVRYMSSIAVDGLRVYWASPAGPQGIHSGDKSGNQRVRVTLPIGGLDFIALDSLNIFYASNKGTVERIRKDASDAGGTVLASNVQTSALAVDTNRVFIATVGGDVFSVASSGSPSTPSVLATGLNGPSAIALDVNCMYFATSGDGVVWALPREGGTPVAIAKGQTQPQSITVDESGVYWSNATGEINVLAR